MSFDAIVRDKLAELTPPPGLKERILASAPDAEETVVPFPSSERSWWQNPKIISLAACVIFIFTFGAIVFDPQSVQAEPDFADFYQDVAGVSIDSPELQIQSDNLGELRQYLIEQGAPAPGQLPPKVDALIEVGASSILWQDVPVALVQMKADDDYLLYVIDLAVFSEGRNPPHEAELHRHEEVCLMAWSHEGQLYVLSLVGTPETLKQLF